MSFPLRSFLTMINWASVLKTFTTTWFWSTYWRHARWHGWLAGAGAETQRQAPWNHAPSSSYTVEGHPGAVTCPACGISFSSELCLGSGARGSLQKSPTPEGRQLFKLNTIWKSAFLHGRGCGGRKKPPPTPPLWEGVFPTSGHRIPSLLSLSPLHTSPTVPKVFSGGSVWRRK